MQIHSARQGNVRWELTTDTETRRKECVARLMRTDVRHRFSWYARNHLRWEKRADLAGGAPKQQQPRQDTLLALSYNIAGFSSKKGELGLMCRERKADFVFLQETLWVDRGWKMSFPGYTIVGCEREEGPGRRGVALAVRKGILALDAGVSTPYCVFAKVLVQRRMMIVGSVYVPQQGRRAALKLIRDSVATLRNRHLQIPVLLGGDWNMDSAKLDRAVGRWNLGLMRVGFQGAGWTWHRGKRRSAIDHFVVSQNLEPKISKAKVDRSWDLSDHWPVGMTMGVTRPLNSGVGMEGGDARGRLANLNRPKLTEVRDKILGHNRFSALLELIESQDEEAVTLEGLSDVVDRFTEDSTRVAEECRVLTTRKNTTKEKRGRRPDRDYLVSSKTCRVVKIRRKAAERLNEALLGNASEATVSARQEAYNIAKDVAKRSVQADKKRSWEKFCEKGAAHLAKGEFRLFWSWIKSVSGQGRAGRSQVVTPVRGSNGELLLDPEDIKNAWADHYGKLCSDPDGTSRSAVFWEDKVTGPPREELEGLNDTVTWREVNDVLAGLKNGKAPGVSGMPVEWLKVAVEKDVGVKPRSAMAAAIFYIVRCMIEKGLVPDSLNKALVVSIPKKGDLTDMDNYRGISLMESLLKVACTVVIRRVGRALENEGLLIPEQAGFRTRQECAAQVVTLYEVCRRRQLAGKETFVAFLDFRKAYDTVPHQALMAKLKHVGVTGMLLRFIEAVYANSRMQVLLPCGRTPEVQLLRGSRQGCPMSPILFDVFINDLFEECRERGVEVPGLGERLPGLLYADDSGLCAANRDDLQFMLDRVGEWAYTWGMSFGIAKCGVFVVNGDMESLRAHPPRLAGENVPVVDEYTYLGIPMNPGLNLDQIAKRRQAKAGKALHVLRGVLGTPTIAVAIKLALIRGSLLPIICYGGEVLGMQHTRAVGLERVLHTAVKLVAGVGQTACGAVLLREFSIDPVHAIMSGAKARGYAKFQTLSTWIGRLTAEDASYKSALGRTWVSGVRMWVRTYGTEEMLGTLLSKQVGDDVICGRLVRETLSQRGWKASVQASVSASRYEELGLSLTNRYLMLSLVAPQLALGVRELVRLRTSSLWSGERAARARIIAERYKTRCPCCEMEGSSESYEHMLLHCTKWASERVTMFETFPEQVQDMIHGWSSDRQLGWSLGEGTDASLRELWLKGGDSEGLENIRRSGWWAVATFLQSIRARRYGLVWRTATFHSENQSPNGYDMS